MPWQDTIKLRFEHNLIIGNTPAVVPLDKAIHIHGAGIDMMAMGLFDTAAPNFSNYYPDVDSKDLVPKEDEFVRPLYRALSEVIVHKSWDPVDFSENGVLKASMSMLRGQTVYPNHEASVGNELGAVEAVSWEGAYKAGDVRVPAGINAILKIDGKSNPKIARGINMNPPSVHSTSVTVRFLWEKSHAELSDEEFWHKIGSFDADGKMIRRIATKILGYNEISLVSKGADPFAQKIGDDGKINNPKEAKVRDTGKLMQQKYFTFNFMDEVLMNSEQEVEQRTIPIISNKNNSTMNKELQTFLLSLVATFGLTGDQFKEDTITQEAVTAALKAHKTKLDIFSAMSTEGVATVEEVKRLKQVEEEYKKLKDKDIQGLEKFQTTVTSTLRDKVQKDYTKLSDGKPNDAILAMINAASYEVLRGLDTQYTQQLEEKFPLTCQSCGESSLTRGSAKKQDPKEEGKKEGDNKDHKTLEDIIREKQNKSAIGIFEEAGE